MEKYYRAALLETEGVGARTLEKLLSYFGTGEAIWQCSYGELKGCPELVAGTAESLWQLLQHKDKPEKLAKICQHKGIKLCLLEDVEYPSLLREIHNPPQVLFYRGSFVGEQLHIGVVGSRKASSYGKAVAEKLGKILGQAGIAVISGAAAGIDSCAHKGALESGTTVAVLGCGVDVAYPPQNRKLIDMIAEKGAVVSEYLPGALPMAARFPARNRIISGIAAGTVVVEAAERSGSLITAEQALDEGRDVFAVPGSIFASNSRGCHKLIQQGAKLVTCCEDIVQEYVNLLQKNIQTQNIIQKNKTRVIMTKDEEQIYNLLTIDNPLSIDDILYKLHGCDAANVAFVLMQLELRGLVRTNEVHCYVRT